MPKALLITLIILSSLIVLAITFVITIGTVFYHISFHRRKGDKNFTKNESKEAKNKPERVWFFSQKIKELTIKSYDHKTLKGYLLDNNGSKKIAILVHGYRGRYYSSVNQAKMFYESGYTVFLNNHRAHDSSSGIWFTMGKKEKFDMISWINKINELYPGCQIVLLGVSMGAHTVMMCAGLKELPNNVKCIIEDCGYASLENELWINLDKMTTPLSKKFIFNCGKLISILFHHHTLKSNTKDSLSKATTPMLFIHGDADTYVPFRCLEENFNNVKEGTYKEKVIFKDCSHNESVYKEPELYKESIITFCNRFIKL